jgi:glycerol-3-phosphate dehydrogenase (NAD(P)+)
MKVTILGAGAWGTALGLRLTENGHQVSMWGRSAGHLADLQRDGVNLRYLPGVKLPSTWRLTTDLPDAVRDSDALVVSVPSKGFREVVTALTGYGGLMVSVTKGVEHESGLTMCGILRELVVNASVSTLSGPSLAAEVARGIPTAVVAASTNSLAAQQTQLLFNGPVFRVYTSNDELGVELGGALKNVVAIAAGVSDGLGFGDNSKAALVTRGIAEIRRLGVACGARAETFAGLGGLGDLTVTCFSKQSRNRAFGERLGRGECLRDILATSLSVVEGYPTSQSSWELARQKRLDTPIIDEVFQLLYRGKRPDQALRALMTREPKAETAD